MDRHIQQSVSQEDWCQCEEFHARQTSVQVDIVNAKERLWTRLSPICAGIECWKKSGFPEYRRKLNLTSRQTKLNRMIKVKPCIVSSRDEILQDWSVSKSGEVKSKKKKKENPKTKNARTT